MDSSANCSLINSLLVDIHRSLLQYSAEAWPWASGDDEGVQEQLLLLAKQQESSIETIVDFLRSRKQLIDFGVYPQDYTSLHFVSLDYFLGRLKESQQGLLNELEAAVGQVAGDEEAVKLVEDAVAANREVLNSLNDTKLPSQA